MKNFTETFIDIKDYYYDELTSTISLDIEGRKYTLFLTDYDFVTFEIDGWRYRFYIEGMERTVYQDTPQYYGGSVEERSIANKWVEEYSNNPF